MKERQHRQGQVTPGREQQPTRDDINRPTLAPSKEYAKMIEEIFNLDHHRQRVLPGTLLTDEEYQMAVKRFDAWHREKWRNRDQVLREAKEAMKERGGRIYPDEPWIEQTRKASRRYYWKHRERILQKQKKTRQQCKALHA